MTSPNKVFSSVSDAFRRTGELLFKPFSWKRWAKLVLIATMAGSLFGGVNLSFGGGDRDKAKDEKRSVVANPDVPETVTDGNIQDKLEKEHEKKYWYEHGLISRMREEYGKVPGWYMAVIVWPVLILIALLLFALILFLIWLCARFQMIWLHAVRTGEVQIRRLFREYESAGDSLATFSVWAWLLSTLYFAALLAPAGFALFKISVTAPKAFSNGAWLIGLFWPWLLLLVFSVLTAAVFFTVISDFVVPLMASECLLFKKAFRSWLAIYSRNRWAVWRYLLVKAVAVVLAGALTSAATLVVLFVFGAAAALVFGAAYLLFAVWIKLKILFILFAALFGIPFFALLVFSFCACALPSSVFFRAFSVSFLDKLERPPAEV